MNKKRILYIICCTLAAAFVFLSHVSASAKKPDNSSLYVTFTDSTNIIQSVTMTSSPCRLLYDPDEPQLTEKLLSEFRESTECFSEYIDLYDYDLSPAEFDYIYRMLVYCSPRSYYLLKNNGTYQYYTYTDKKKNIVYGVTPVYQLDIYDDSMNIIPDNLSSLLPEIEENIALLDNEIERIESLLNPGMTEVEKLMTVHNFMNINYDYSYEDYSENYSSTGHNTAMLLARDKKGMCLAFSTLFNYIAMDQGIDTGFILSYFTDGSYSSEYHTWSLVHVAATPGGEKKWYHIDVSWDDTLSSSGGCSMKYFMLSDEKMRQTHEFTLGEYKIFYDPLFVETGKEFDGAKWRGAASQLLAANGKWYFIAYSDTEKKSVLYEYDPLLSDTDAYKELFSFDDKWSADTDGSSFYAASFSGLGYVNGKLYFNGSKKIYSFSLNSGFAATVFELPENSGENIYSCYCDGASLIYGTKPEGSSPSDPVTESGSLRAADISVTASRIVDGKIYVNLKQLSDSAEANEIQVFVLSDAGYSSWNGSGSDQQLSFDVGASQTAKVFVWDNNMRPISEYCEVSQ